MPGQIENALEALIAGVVYDYEIPSIMGKRLLPQRAEGSREVALSRIVRAHNDRDHAARFWPKCLSLTIPRVTGPGRKRRSRTRNGISDPGFSRHALTMSLRAAPR